MTGTGKSTLQTELIARFRQNYPQSYVFIVDSKPRYRAHFLATGVPISYKNWVPGDFLPQSVVVHSEMTIKNLYSLWPIIILQSQYPNGEDVEHFEKLAAWYAQKLFQFSSPKHPTLFVIDEYYDILSGGLAAIAPRSILKTIR
ncbi:MAG: hypothetical protein ACREHG_03540, partial [Candidatus Saccharimonadales bacterium]